MRNTGWKALQIIQLIVFTCFSVFLFTRAVDGHGAVQTFDAKLISFAVWGLFYLGILAVEWLIYAIARLSRNNSASITIGEGKLHGRLGSSESRIQLIGVARAPLPLSGTAGRAATCPDAVFG